MFDLLCLISMYLTTSVAYAAAPEGFENFALINSGTPTSGFSSMVSYNNPAWTSDHESMEAIGNSPIGNHLLTYGGKLTVGNKLADRDAYFLRGDLILFGVDSLALKWTHEDWKYINSSKDSYGAEYTRFVKFTEKSGLYFVVGGYYRYLKQRWNQPWWSPLNTNTKDQEGYPTGALGYKSALGMKSFFTFDINIRDSWSYYGLDNVAFDLQWYIGDKNLLFKILTGVRTSATWVGTMYPANIYGGFGFVSYQ